MELDFSKPLPDSDQVLVVEEREFHVHRSVLGLWSPVFRAMFNKKFKEAKMKRIELPGKKADMFDRFLMLLYSPYDMNLPKEGWIGEEAYKNILLILEYIREYQASKALEIMEKKLYEYISKTKDDSRVRSWPGSIGGTLQCKLKTYMSLLNFADQFDLTKVTTAILPLLKYFTRTNVVADPYFKVLSCEMKQKLMSEIACQLETSLLQVIRCTRSCSNCTSRIKDTINHTHYETHFSASQIVYMSSSSFKNPK